MHFFDLGLSQFCFGKHAFYGVLENILRLFVFHDAVGRFPKAADVPGVMKIFFLRLFRSADDQLLHIDDDDAIACVDIRSKISFMFFIIPLLLILMF